MRVLGSWFKAAREPVELVKQSPLRPPTDYPAQLIVSPDRSEARLIGGDLARLFEGHHREMYLPNKGRVRVFYNQQAWTQAVGIISLYEAMSAMVKPDQELVGSGVTVHYPKGEDYGIVVSSEAT